MSFASILIYASAAAAITFFAYRFLYGTDTPHIKGLPEIPGLPLFGSLIELGEHHALVAQRWAKKYGPVFQVRMGSRVSAPSIPSNVSLAKRQLLMRPRELFLPTALIPSGICGLPTSLL